MTPLTWLLLAAALAVCATPGRLPRRVGALVGGGRLVDVGAGASAANRPGLSRRWLAAPRASPAVGALAAGIGLVGGVLAGGGPIGVAGAAVGGTGWLLLRDLRATRAANAGRAHLLSAVRVLVAELEAGTRPSAALAAAAEAGPLHADGFRAAADAAAGAHDAGAVLAGRPETRLIGLAWRLGEDTGVALAAVLARVAADLAAADEQRRTVAVALAGPRSSAFLLTGLPLLGIALGITMGAHPTQFLTQAGPGRTVCCVGVLLDVAGVLWMRRILRRAERP
jgi:tight adherence protein B